MIVRVLLTPFSILWDALYRLRRFSYQYGIVKKERFMVPIISVGNLTFGGTGKTPFTLWLAQKLGGEGKKVMILMRGYKGKLENEGGVLRSNSRLGYNPFDYGDEALLYAKKLNNASVVVGKKRAENLRRFFNAEKPDVVILDDGHQHIGLERNLNIVLFDGLMECSRYKTAPLGYLREGMSALSDADIILIGRADMASEGQKTELRSLLDKHRRSDSIIGEIFYRPTQVLSIGGDFLGEIDFLKERKVICLTGIASPESFYRLVKESGANLVSQFDFPDHHYYSAEDLAPIEELAEEEDALILTTEKDIVKLRRVLDNPRVVFIEVQVQFLRGEEEVIQKVQEKIL